MLGVAFAVLITFGTYLIIAKFDLARREASDNTARGSHGRS